MKAKEIDFSIRDTTQRTQEFKTLLALRKFLQAEAKYWSAQKKLFLEKHGSNSPVQNYQSIHRFLGMGSEFEAKAKAIIEWQPELKEWDARQLHEKLNALLNSGSIANGNWLWSGHSYAGAFAQCAIEHGAESGEAFLDYIVKKNVNNVSNYSYLKGYFSAYEFTSQDSSIVKRRNSEKIALGHLRNQFIEARDEAYSDIKVIEEWDRTNRAHASRVDQIHRKLAKRKDARQSNKFEFQFNEWQERIKELEAIYEEKLRLSAPAKYWGQRANSLKCQGIAWAFLLGIACLSSAATVGCFFWLWLQHEPLPLSLASLQGAALFGVTSAALFFFIRMLSKLTFSAFHLQRDAEEREQLTHVYLALMNDGIIDQSARDIVLQAIFSRADSGLLAGDHSPTMPSAGDIVAGLSRVRTQA